MNDLLQGTQGLSQSSLTPPFQTPLCLTPSPIQIQSLAAATLASAPATAAAFPPASDQHPPYAHPSQVHWHQLCLPNSYSPFGVPISCHLLFAASPTTGRQSAAPPLCSHTLPPHLLTPGNKHKCQALCFKVLLTILTLNSHRSPIM